MRKLGILSLLLVSCISASIAKGQTVRIEEKTYTTCEVGKSVDNWYLMMQLGPNLMMSANDSKAAFGDRIGDNISFMAGKWVTPVFGVRFGISYLMTKGATKMDGMFRKWGQKEIANYIYPEQMQAYGPELDMTVNLTNWSRGYLDNRWYEAVGHIGFGMYITSAYRHMNKVYGWYSLKTKPMFANIGLQNTFRLSDRFSLLLDVTYELIAFDTYTQDLKVSGGIVVNVGNNKWNAKTRTVITQTQIME